MCRFWGSRGPEAPLVQVIGSTGTWLGKQFRLKEEELRSMSIAGMAPGFTALFGVPLGSSLFALEILHNKHVVEYYKSIIPAFVASCFSYVIFALIIHLGLGAIPLFFICAALGIVLHTIFPQLNLSLAVISCLTAINACVTRTPLSTTILLSTLTGFSYFIPIMFASLTGYFFAPRLPFISAQSEKNFKSEVITNHYTNLHV